MLREQRLFALRTFSLAADIRRKLLESGIYARTRLTKESDDHMPPLVRGEESGGATEEIGRYVTFAGEIGEAIGFTQRVESRGGNGLHAIVAAPILLRIDVLRFKRICDVVITKHQFVRRSTGSHRLRSTTVFRGTDGILEYELWTMRERPFGTFIPNFFAEALGEIEVPPPLRAAVAASILGACCIRCSHNHYSAPCLPAEIHVPDSATFAPGQPTNHNPDERAKKLVAPRELSNLSGENVSSSTHSTFQPSRNQDT